MLYDFIIIIINHYLETEEKLELNATSSKTGDDELKRLDGMFPQNNPKHADDGKTLISLCMHGG